MVKTHFFETDYKAPLCTPESTIRTHMQRSCHPSFAELTGTRRSELNHVLAKNSTLLTKILLERTKEQGNSTPDIKTAIQYFPRNIKSLLYYESLAVPMWNAKLKYSSGSTFTPRYRNCSNLKFLLFELWRHAVTASRAPYNRRRSRLGRSQWALQNASQQLTVHFCLSVSLLRAEACSIVHRIYFLR